MTGTGLGVLGALLIGFVASYVLIPWVIARCLLHICPSISPLRFVLIFTIIIISLIIIGTWITLVVLNTAEAKEIALTGENDIGVGYGGLEMSVIIADLIGLTVSLWSGLSVMQRRLNATENAAE